MFRTRDFVLFLTTVAFLLLAIGVTLLERNDVENDNQTPTLVETEIMSVTANVVESDEGGLSRAERLERLRQKIQESELVSFSEPEPDTLQSPSSQTGTSTTSVSSQPLLCPGYTPTPVIYWPIESIQTEETEGVRQYFIEQEVVSGTSTIPIVERTVLLSLPIKFVPSGQPHCLSADVIGIALDGSLIRNDEASLYNIFSDDTLIGYALDGYPIYGTGTQTVDQCGGRIELGQYRYELKIERPTILNCFADSSQRFLQ